MCLGLQICLEATVWHRPFHPYLTQFEAPARRFFPETQSAVGMNRAHQLFAFFFVMKFQNSKVTVAALLFTVSLQKKQCYSYKLQQNVTSYCPRLVMGTITFSRHQTTHLLKAQVHIALVLHPNDQCLIISLSYTQFFCCALLPAPSDWPERMPPLSLRLSPLTCISPCIPSLQRRPHRLRHFVRGGIHFDTV